MSHWKPLEKIGSLALVVMLLLTGCQVILISPTPLPSPTPIPAPTITPTAPPTAMPTPTYHVRSDGLQTLLAYIPSQWADYHPDDILGPAIHFLDIAQMRQDLGLPSVTGADSREDKLSLLTGMNTQGFGLGFADLDFRNARTFEEWGWDIADVDQTLYFEGGDSCILLGNFQRPEIKRRLLDKGYKERTVRAFEVFVAENKSPKFALKSDTLIISSRETTLEDLIPSAMGSRQGLDRHPSVASLLEHLDSAWGALLAPTGNIGAVSDGLRGAKLPSEFGDAVLQAYRLYGEPQIAWDMMAIGFWGTKGITTTLTFLYHYPSSQEATADIAVAKKSLTEIPSLSRRGQTWGDLLELRNVGVNDSVLKATATTKNKSLIGPSIANRDMGYLVIRQGSPKATKGQVTSSPVPPTATQTLSSTLATGWILYEKPIDGFAIALPPAWKQIDMDLQTIDAMIKFYKETDPQMADLMEKSRSSVSAGLKFMAFDLAPGSRTKNYLTNVTVEKSRLQAEISLNVYVQIVAGQMENMASVVKPISHRRVTFAGGEAEQLQYDVVFKLVAETVKIHITQYVVIQGKDIYVLSLAVQADQSYKYTSTFEKIAQSFRLSK